MSVLSERLAAMRKSRGLTQQQVVDRSEGLIGTIQVYSNYEKGNRNPDYETLCQLATIYGVTTDFLLGRTDEELPQVKEFRDATGLSGYAISVITALPNEATQILSNMIESFKFPVFLDRLLFFKETKDLSSKWSEILSDSVKISSDDFPKNQDISKRMKSSVSSRIIATEGQERYARFDSIDAATQLIDSMIPLTNWDKLKDLCEDNELLERLERYARSIGENDFADFIADKGEYSR